MEHQRSERKRFSGVWAADLVAQQQRIMALEAQLGLTPAEWWKPAVAKLRRSFKGSQRIEGAPGRLTPHWWKPAVTKLQRYTFDVITNRMMYTSTNHEGEPIRVHFLPSKHQSFCGINMFWCTY
jgi:hypothetical protein